MLPFIDCNFHWLSMQLQWLCGVYEEYGPTQTKLFSHTFICWFSHIDRTIFVIQTIRDYSAFLAYYWKLKLLNNQMQNFFYPDHYAYLTKGSEMLHLTYCALAETNWVSQLWPISSRWFITIYIFKPFVIVDMLYSVHTAIQGHV